ncbi:MAG: DinB family protein [Candidatus Pristimantibacillus sp.]
MNGVMHIRDHLLEELALSVRTSQNLIKRIQSEEWTYRPQDNMRNLLELVHHLVTIPVTDLAILQESTQQEVNKVENSVSEMTDPVELANRFQSNFETLKMYIVNLTEDELLNKSTKAFYLDHGKLQIQWLIEIVTHTFHHRSQLYNYLKQQGHELQFFLLYE